MEVQDINRLLKQHSQMAKMMKKFSSPSGIGKMMRGIQTMQGKMGGNMGGSGGGMGPLFGGSDQDKK